MARAVVLAEGHLGRDLGKTANGLVLHAVKDKIVAVIDSTQAGNDAGKVVAGKPLGIPVVASFEEAYARFQPETFYLGVATVGGILPPNFRTAIREALERGLTVVNGLHTFLSEDPEFSQAAITGNGRIWDVRRPPEGLRVADGRIYDVPTPRVLVMGMDCDIGKRVTVVELLQAARRRGINAGFVATGQTGCMLSPDAGAVIDRVPSDFCAGQVEKMVTQVAEKGREMIFIYGQASIRHPAFSGVSLSILHGSAPHAIVLQHAPGRTRRVVFDHPKYTLGSLQEEIELIERLGTGKVVAIAINSKDCKNVEAACQQITMATGLPAVDPLQGNPDELLDAVLDHLIETGAYKPQEKVLLVDVQTRSSSTQTALESEERVLRVRERIA